MPAKEITDYISNKLFSNKTKKYLKSIWAKPIKRKRNFEIIENFTKMSRKNDLYIDDITCGDININDIFCLIDRTVSTAGEHILYNILRNPLHDKQKLEQRNEIIKLFSKNDEIREKYELLLYKLGRNKSDVTSILYNKLEERPNLNKICNICAISSIISIVSLIITRSPWFVMSTLLIFFINMALHSKLGSIVKQQVASVKYFGDILNIASKMAKIKCYEMNPYSQKLIIITENCGKIGRKSSSIGRIEGLDVIGDYINILFLNQERNYFSVLSDIERHKSELVDLYFLVGEIDALISIASYRAELKKYTEPIFIDEPKLLSVKNIIHPLIENAVPNSIDIDNNGVIITGSNMAGKSTFLRTLAVNALFAQTIYTCLADSYTSSFFNIITAIEPQDNIMKGKSYYLGEAEAILRVVNVCKSNISCLTMIDEIFRGTNPIERINAAAEIMDYLNKNNVLAFVATHDLVLTKMVNNYDCYYFREDVDGNGLTFDYLLKKGISPTRNAIRLLKLVGYPKDITDRIEDKIKKETYKNDKL